jgi:bacterioferritin-associated ferredoxin
MYVCICKGVTEGQIREAVRGGLCTRKDVSRCLKVGTACGKCNPEVRALLQQCCVPAPDADLLVSAGQSKATGGTCSTPPRARSAEPASYYARNPLNPDAERVDSLREPAMCPA